MGKKLIIKDADFSENAVSVSPNYEETYVGSSRFRWNEATATASSYSGWYGFLCPFEGYVTGIIINTLEAYNNGEIAIWQKNTGTKIRSININVNQGFGTYMFAPLYIEADTVITYRGASTKYGEQNCDGDWPTNANMSVMQEPPYRIYCYNFIVQKITSN